MSPTDVEIRTRSVPTAGHLICMGFEPIGIIVRDGEKIIRFPSDASTAMNDYLAAKRRVDQMLECEEPAQ